MVLATLFAPLLVLSCSPAPFSFQHPRFFSPPQPPPPTGASTLVERMRGRGGPSAESAHQRFLRGLGIHHEQHALLGFREQELVGRSFPFFAPAQIEIQLDPQATLAAISEQRSEAGGAMSWGGTTPRSWKASAGFNQTLLEEGSPTARRGDRREGGVSSAEAKAAPPNCQLRGLVG